MEWLGRQSEDNVDYFEFDKALPGVRPFLQERCPGLVHFHVDCSVCCLDMFQTFEEWVGDDEEDESGYESSG